MWNWSLGRRSQSGLVIPTSASTRLPATVHIRQDMPQILHYTESVMFFIKFHHEASKTRSSFSPPAAFKDIKKIQSLSGHSCLFHSLYSVHSIKNPEALPLVWQFRETAAVAQTEADCMNWATSGVTDHHETTPAPTGGQQRAKGGKNGWGGGTSVVVLQIPLC